MPRSGIWNYFTKCGDNEATCSICYKTIKTAGGTTNMRQHLKKKHTEYFWAEKSTGNESETLIADFIVLKDPPKANKSSQSPIWNYFNKSGEKEAICSVCDKTIKMGAGITKLKYHLKRKHPEYCSEEAEGKTETVTLIVDSPIKITRKTQSAVWEYFTKLGINEAKCSLCSKTVKTGGGTSNLRQHIKSKHPEHFMSTVGCKSETPETPVMLTNAKCQLPESDTAELLTILPSRSRSPTPTPKRRCPKQTKLDSLIIKSSHKNAVPADADLTKALVYMVCRDNLPHSFVEGNGFNRFMNAAVPRFKVPNRETVTEMISVKYAAAVSSVKTALADAVDLSLTADICTVTNTAKVFLVVTAHLIDHQERKLETILLGIRHIQQTYTAEHVVQAMEDLLQIFDIPKEKIVGICTDGGIVMTTVVNQLLGEGKNVHCFVRTLNSIVSDGLEDPNNERLRGVIYEINYIVSLVQHNNEFMEKLRLEQDATDGNAILLEQSVPQRWDSTYRMLKSFLKLAPVIAQILTDPEVMNAPYMIPDADLDLVREVLDILMPFDEAMKEISCSEYFAGSLVIPLVSILENVLKNVNDVQDDTRIFSQKLMSGITDRKTKLLHNTLLCHAVLSDPRFKRMYMNLWFADKAIASFSEEVKSYLDKISPSQETEELDTTPNLNLLWSTHDQVVSKSTPTECGDSEIPNELKVYLQEPLQSRSSNPFAIWENSRRCAPALSVVALRYLCLVGTSVPSEQLVATINGIVSDESSEQSEQRIMERIFLNRLQDKYWPMG